MTSTAESLTLEAFLDTLPDDRRAPVAQVWQLVRDHMPAGYEERIGPKFLEFRAGADEYVALANQKNYVSLYLIPVYVDPALKQQLDAALVDKKVKSGRACLNFKKVEELPMETIGEIIGSMTPTAFQERMKYNRTAHRA